MWKLRKSNTATGRAVSRGGRKVSRKKKIPADIKQCIKGKVVDLSTTSEYFRKCWESASPRVQALIRKRVGHRYELVNTQFFEFFLDHLRERHASHNRMPLDSRRFRMSAGDLCALALYNAAHLFGRTNLKSLEPSPYLLWPSDRPISEAWRRLGDVSLGGGGTSITLEDPGPGQRLRLPRPGKYEHERITLGIHWMPDREKLPKLDIKIEGEPVALLMKAMFILEDLDDRKRTRKDALRIWNSLLKLVLIMMGVGKPKGGRPSLYLRKEAARLHYHDGLSWSEVAGRLCPYKDHHRRVHGQPRINQHARACRENFRKQAAQFFSAIRKNTSMLPPVTI